MEGLKDEECFLFSHRIKAYFPTSDVMMRLRFAHMLCVKQFAGYVKSNFSAFYLGEIFFVQTR